MYVKAGLEKEKAALLVVIGPDVHGKKHLLAVEAGVLDRVSEESTGDFAAEGLAAVLEPALREASYDGGLVTFH